MHAPLAWPTLGAATSGPSFGHRYCQHCVARLGQQRPALHQAPHRCARGRIGAPSGCSLVPCPECREGFCPECALHVDALAEIPTDPLADPPTPEDYLPCILCERSYPPERFVHLPCDCNCGVCHGCSEQAHAARRSSAAPQFRCPFAAHWWHQGLLTLRHEWGIPPALWAGHSEGRLYRPSTRQSIIRLHDAVQIIFSSSREAGSRESRQRALRPLLDTANFDEDTVQRARLLVEQRLGRRVPFPRDPPSYDEVVQRGGRMTAGGMPFRITDVSGQGHNCLCNVALEQVLIHRQDRRQRGLPPADSLGEPLPSAEQLRSFIVADLERRSDDFRPVVPDVEAYLAITRRDNTLGASETFSLTNVIGGAVILFQVDLDQWDMMEGSDTASPVPLRRVETLEPAEGFAQREAPIILALHVTGHWMVLHPIYGPESPAALPLPPIPAGNGAARSATEGQQQSEQPQRTAGDDQWSERPQRANEGQTRHTSGSRPAPQPAPPPARPPPAASGGPGIRGNQNLWSFRGHAANPTRDGGGPSNSRQAGSSGGVLPASSPVPAPFADGAEFQGSTHRSPQGTQRQTYMSRAPANVRRETPVDGSRADGAVRRSGGRGREQTLPAWMTRRGAGAVGRGVEQTLPQGGGAAGRGVERTLPAWMTRQAAIGEGRGRGQPLARPPAPPAGFEPQAPTDTDPPVRWVFLTHPRRVFIAEDQSVGSTQRRPIFLHEGDGDPQESRSRRDSGWQRRFFPDEDPEGGGEDPEATFEVAAAQNIMGIIPAPLAGLQDGTSIEAPMEVDDQAPGRRGRRRRRRAQPTRSRRIRQRRAALSDDDHQEEVLMDVEQGQPMDLDAAVGREAAPPPTTRQSPRRPQRGHGGRTTHTGGRRPSADAPVVMTDEAPPTPVPVLMTDEAQPTLHPQEGTVTRRRDDRSLDDIIFETGASLDALIAGRDDTLFEADDADAAQGEGNEEDEAVGLHPLPEILDAWAEPNTGGSQRRGRSQPPLRPSQPPPRVRRVASATTRRNQNLWSFRGHAANPTRDEGPSNSRQAGSSGGVLPASSPVPAPFADGAEFQGSTPRSPQGTDRHTLTSDAPANVRRGTSLDPSRADAAPRRSGSEAAEDVVSIGVVIWEEEVAVPQRDRDASQRSGDAADGGDGGPGVRPSTPPPQRRSSREHRPPAWIRGADFVSPLGARAPATSTPQNGDGSGPTQGSSGGRRNRRRRNQRPRDTPPDGDPEDTRQNPVGDGNGEDQGEARNRNGGNPPAGAAAPSAQPPPPSPPLPQGGVPHGQGGGSGQPGGGGGGPPGGDGHGGGGPPDGNGPVGGGAAHPLNSGPHWHRSRLLLPRLGVNFLTSRTEKEHVQHFKLGIRSVTSLPPSIRWSLKEAIDATENLLASDSPDASDEGCLVLLYLPTLLLFPMKRGGTSGWRKWQTRFRKFWNGNWDELLREASTFAAKGADVLPQSEQRSTLEEARDPEDCKHRAAHKLVSQGELARAAKRLTSVKVAAPTADTLSQLQSLHPRAREELTKPDVDPASAARSLDVSREFLVAALKSSPRGSAPGPTGWRYEHLRAYLGEARSDEEAVPASSFVHRVLQGNLPPTCRRILAAARLFALEKPQRGVRPIAIGDTLRRWITRAICMENKLMFADDFSPLQFAVGTEAGSEKLFRAAQTYIEAAPTGERRTLITLDAKNAFNSISRAAVLGELAEKYPWMVDFFWQFYGTPAELWYRMEDGQVETILSEEGTQQGDAAGSLLFCLGFQPALKQLQSEFPDEFVGGFMDDVEGGMTDDKVNAFVAAAERIFLTYHLQLRREKSHAWCPAWQTDGDIPAAAKPALQCSTRGVKVLGAPIGTTDFIKASLKKINDDHADLLGALVAFSEKHMQDASLLLRYCALPRFTYWSRLLPPHADTILHAAATHDKAIIDTACDIFKLPSPSMRVLSQMQLPLRLGGLGLTSAASVSQAAFLGSVAVSAGDVFERYREAPWMPQSEATFLALPWLAAATMVRDALDVSLPDMDLPAIEDLTIGEPHRRLQKTITTHIHKRDFNELFESLPPASRGRAHLLSCQGPGASGWLTAIPTSPRNSLNNFQYRVSVLLRLGLTLPATLLTNRCTCDGAIDQNGDHFFLCHRGGQRILKHNALRDMFRKLFGEVNLPADIEVYLSSIGVTPPNSNPRNQRMDLYLVVDGEGILADVTVTHPCRQNTTANTSLGRQWRLINRRASQRPGGSEAREAEKEKDKLYGQTTRQAGMKFVPLAAETLGRWGNETVKLLQELAKRKRRPIGAAHGEGAAPEGDSFREGVVNHWFQYLSVALMKYNAYQITARAHTAARESGPSYADVFNEDLISRGPYRPHFRPFRPF